MASAEIKKVGIIGCGLMGSGIAEVCARSGYATIVREVNADFLAAGFDRIEKSLDRALSRNKLSQAERDDTLARFERTTEMAELADCDIVIEAITENSDAKKSLHTELDGLLGSHAILASNTSSISITDLAAATDRGDRFIGVHFMNPVPVMPLVEMIRGLQTSDATYDQARSFAESLGKTTILAKDRPGFAINIILVPYLMEAVRTIEAGTVSKEDLDKGMKLGCNMPMGPLELADFVGLDTTLFIADVLFEEYRDPRYAAPILLRRMVAAGWNGRKAGKGFYDYPASRS